MNILIACEESGTVRDAFAALGHNAWSCDKVESRKPGNHFKCDIREVLVFGYQWDLLIAHTPCTYLCNSGVRWLHEQEGRWEKMTADALLFKDVMLASVPKIAMENPIPHKYALEIIGPKYDQIIQPWQFGHGETKATCLWLKGLPKLQPTNIVEGREQRIWKMAPSPDRQRERSVTYLGIAQAMAEQWGT